MVFSSLKKILNFLFFQLAWWGIFLLGKNTNADNCVPAVLLMFLVVLFYIFLHFKFISVHPAQDILLAKKSLFWGFLLDGSMLTVGLLKPGPSLQTLDLGMQWIALLTTLVSLWIIYSLTLNSSLAALRKKPGLFILCCLFFGPISYLAPLNVGFIEYARPTMLSTCVHGILWGVWAYFLSSQRFLRRIK